MCEIVEKLEKPIPNGIGYKIIILTANGYIGPYSKCAVKIGKAASLESTDMSWVVTYNSEHRGKYSFFKRKKDAKEYASDLRERVLRCEVKNITHLTVFNGEQCFLAEEIVSITKVY